MAGCGGGAELHGDGIVRFGEHMPAACDGGVALLNDQPARDLARAGRNPFVDRYGACGPAGQYAVREPVRIDLNRP